MKNSQCSMIVFVLCSICASLQTEEWLECFWLGFAIAHCIIGMVQTSQEKKEEKLKVKADKT